MTRKNVKTMTLWIPLDTPRDEIYEARDQSPELMKHPPNPMVPSEEEAGPCSKEMPKRSSKKIGPKTLLIGAEAQLKAAGKNQHS